MQKEDKEGSKRRNEPRGATIRKDGGAWNRGEGGRDRYRLNDEEDNLTPADRNAATRPKAYPTIAREKTVTRKVVQL